MTISPQQLAAFKRLAHQRGLTYLLAESQALGLSYRRFLLGTGRRRFGSCSRDGDIRVSWYLLFAPPEVFRYVVLHEVCHLRHFDHSAAFWALVRSRMPDYAQHHDWLRRYGARLSPERWANQVAVAPHTSSAA